MLLWSKSDKQTQEAQPSHSLSSPARTLSLSKIPDCGTERSFLKSLQNIRFCLLGKRKMSTGEARKVSVQDIQLVQDLIQRCLQLYMTQKEVVSTLLHHARIDPDFTELVWHKLKAENRAFFEAYDLRLLVKDHILRFNDLLAKQVELIHQICSTEVDPVLQETSKDPFASLDLVSLPINEFILDPEVNSFGFLREIDFSSSTDILEGYSGSPILGTEMSFVDPCFLGEHQDIERLDATSQRLSYEDFGNY